MHPAAESFRSVADLYERARPGYPAEAVAFLVDRLGLGDGQVVVDLAAGTGKLTRELVGHGARVVAVEPLDEMRAVLARLLPEVEEIEATAESLPFADGSIDAVTVAQAFHWFDPDRAFPEIARVLRPGGALALVANHRDLGDTLQAEIRDIVESYRGDAPSANVRPWQDWLAGPQTLFGVEEKRAFPWELACTADMAVERIASVSFIAALEPDEREAALDRVRAAVGGRPEPFPFRYTTGVAVLPRLPD